MHHTIEPTTSRPIPIMRGQPDSKQKYGLPPSTNVDKPPRSDSAGIVECTEAMVTRAYQTEMYEESLKRNIIVTMDTGSGKTQVAVLRIIEKLRHIGLDRKAALQEQIRSVQVRSFTSEDNVDRWTGKEPWDYVLRDVSVAVATYGVLNEALSHRYVDFHSIALIVVDEGLLIRISYRNISGLANLDNAAHNCIGNSPLAKIMDEYRRSKGRGELVPEILGLTASPVIGARTADLSKLEERMDAICTSPRVHRENLLSHANRPIMTLERYETGADVPLTQSVSSLQEVYRGLNLQADPDVLRWKSEDTEKSNEKLKSVLMKKTKTFAQSRVSTFCRTSETLCQQVGPLAADIYVAKVTSMVIGSVTPDDSASHLTWEYSSMVYIADALKRVEVDRKAPLKITEPDSITPKMQCLIRILSSQDLTSRGIVFVKERVTAVVISHLLSRHPVVKEIFRVGAIVGTSKREAARRDLGDTFSNAEQSNFLVQFRDGGLNLLVATSVLEEGIDVSACNLVVCFDEPSSLKAVIQQRGRARKRNSKYVMLVDEKERGKSGEWERLEKDMRDQYEKEDKASQSAETLARAEVTSHRQFRVPRTEALLDMDNAKNYLQVFCARVSSRRYTDKLPYYVIQELNPRWGVRDDETPRLRAKVVLPAFIAPKFRTTWSKSTWRSEKNATKDAAFEAYLRLYYAGLVDEHLSALASHGPSALDEDSCSIIQASGQINPWAGVAKAWKRGDDVQNYVATLTDEHDHTKCVIGMTIPANLHQMEPILIHQNNTEVWKVVIKGATELGTRRGVDGGNAAKLLSLPRGYHFRDQHGENLVVFSATETRIGAEKHQETLLDTGLGEVGYDDLVRQLNALNISLDGRMERQPEPPTKQPETATNSEASSGREGLESQPSTNAENWPQPTHFMHHQSNSGVNMVDGNQSRNEPLSVPKQPRLRTYSVVKPDPEFCHLIPLILYKIEGQLVAQQLYRTLLSEGGIGYQTAANYVRSAITVPARIEGEYQRLEFVGDTCLKFLSAVYFTAKYPDWPEGYLTVGRANMISKQNLCRAALDCGLDMFVLTKTFSTKAWRQVCLDDVRESPNGDGTRPMAGRTLADVVKSIIGAGKTAGGYPGALAWTKILLRGADNTLIRGMDLPSLEVGRRQLFDTSPGEIRLPSALQPLEALLDYTFGKKGLLIEATTHSSNLTDYFCYDRLVFLGSAIIESIVVDEIYAQGKSISCCRMHRCRAAVVNRDYLGFVALEWHIVQRRATLVDGPVPGTLSQKKDLVTLSLCHFLAHQSKEVMQEMQRIESRFLSCRGFLARAITSGSRHPWTLLAELRADSFCADMVESLVGAVWVDSGTMEACRKVLDRMGVLPYLRRIIRDQVRTIHPKEELNVLAKSSKVSYETTTKTDIKGNTQEVTCLVYVGDRKVAEVCGAGTREVEVKAAEEAVSLLGSADDDEYILPSV